MTTTDDDQAVRLIATLAVKERNGTAEKSTLKIGPWSSFVLVSALQLAWRHPDLAPTLRADVESIARQVQSQFGPPVADLLEKGWDVAQDVPPRKRTPIYEYEPVNADVLPDDIEWSEPVHDPVMFGSVSYGRSPLAGLVAVRPPERGCPWMALTWDVSGETRFYQLAE